MKRRIAAIMLTAGIFRALIEETIAPFIKALLESKTAGFIRSLFQEKEAQEEGHADATPNRRPGGIDQWSEEVAGLTSLDPALIKAVIQVESGGDPTAVSNKGACGLMQLMPETSRILKVDDPFDPKQNIIGGAGYLRYQLDEFGDIDLALAAYNAGPMAVKRYGRIPPFKETREYVRMVKKSWLNSGK